MYKYEQWKEVKAVLNLTNKKIAEIIGKTEDNVKKQLGPSKKLPTWARAMIFVFEKTKLTTTCEAPGIGAIIKINPDVLDKINNTIKWDDVKSAPEFDASLLEPHPLKKCDCHIDAGGIFRRGKIKCKLSKDQHNF